VQHVSGCRIIDAFAGYAGGFVPYESE
jgi:hypothetical protein